MASILLVDDNIDILRTHGAVLRRSGYEVVTAADGDIALQLAEQYEFDLVITDILMPGKEGIEIIIELRNRISDQKIIAMSGGGTRFNTNDCLAIARGVGVSVTLSKPFSAAEMLKAVESQLNPQP